MFKCKLTGMDGRFVSKNKKVFNNAKLAEDVLGEMYGEFFIGKDLCHPNIIEYKYFIKIYDQPSNTHEIHILMEYLDGGDMDSFLKEKGPATDESWAKKITSEILSALVYLHDDCKIIHQDLKPGNILFNAKKDSIKVIDLGVSSKLEKTRSSKGSGRGTLRYMPPE